jgi:hypothetical protein
MAKEQSVPVEPAAPAGHLLSFGDEFLNTAKAAAVLDRSPKTLEFWRTRGVGPRYYCQGRRVRYLYSDVIRWATRHPIEPGRDTSGKHD